MNKDYLTFISEFALWWFLGPITSQIDRDLETDQPDSQIDGGQLPGLVMWILGAIFIYFHSIRGRKIVLGFTIVSFHIDSTLW